MIRHLKKWMPIMLALVSVTVVAETSVALDTVDLKYDAATLQRGATVFVNYCLGCHSMRSVRMAKLDKLELTDEQIKNNLLLNGVGLGETMIIALTAEEAKNAFGAAPPDLSLIARAKSTAGYRGADWIYMFLRTFYQDNSRPLGWNNRVVEASAMPHVLYHLQGIKTIVTDEKTQKTTMQTITAGEVTPLEYDETVRDLVSFLAYVSEPEKQARQWLGVFAFVFLLGLFVLTYAVKQEFWKNVH